MKNLSRVNYAKLLYVKILDTDQLYDTNVTFSLFATCKCFVTFESSGCDYEKYFTYFEGIYIILTWQRKNCLIVSLRTFGSCYKLICSTNSSDANIKRGLLTVCLHSLYCEFVYTHVKTRKSSKKIFVNDLSSLCTGLLENILRGKIRVQMQLWISSAR